MIGSFKIAAIFAGLGIGLASLPAQMGKQSFRIAVSPAPASGQLLLTLEDVVFPSAQSAILRAYLPTRTATSVYLGSTALLAVSTSAHGNSHYKRLAIPLSQTAVRQIRKIARRDSVTVEIIPVDSQRRVLANISWTVSRVRLTRVSEK
jgi:hypothetical protein